MGPYLAAAENVEGITKREPKDEKTIVCPKCKGYGKWNLRLNAYGEGRHFQAGCNQCRGYGYVQPGIDAECIHALDNGVTIGRCLTRYTCKKCGKQEEWDSSD